MSDATTTRYSASHLQLRQLGGMSYVETELPAIELPEGDWEVAVVAEGSADAQPYRWTIAHP